VIARPCVVRVLEWQVEIVINPIEHQVLFKIPLVCVVVCRGVDALVHTPADVIGGAIIGSVGIFWYFYGQKPKKPVK
jgi:hypothetical protein